MPVYTIYKIQCGDEVYIGSTRDFIQRKVQHKSCCNKESCKEYNLKIYQAIRENGGWDSKNITPIELVDCETMIEARIREEYWRREYEATLNMVRAYQTIDERTKERKNSTIEWKAKNPNYQREYRAKKKAAAINLQNSKPVEKALQIEATP